MNSFEKKVLKLVKGATLKNSVNSTRDGETRNRALSLTLSQNHKNNKNHKIFVRGKQA